MRALLICILFALLFTAANAEHRGLPDPVIPDCLGVNIHLRGQQDEQARMMFEAGFKFIRMDFSWSRIETVKGQYDFTQYDQLVDSLAKNGIRALFILDYGNDFYDGGKAPHTDEGREAFARFAEAGVSHFKGRGILWELWNEPNHSTFWKPDSNVGDYVKLAKAVYPRVKRADSTALLLGPALAGWDFDYLEEAFKKGLLDSLDAISVHPYGSSIPEDAYLYYSTIRALVSKYARAGRRFPVVSGEWGYSAINHITVERQSQYIAREFLVNLANDIPLSIWYDWSDDGLDPKEIEHNFGVLYHDLSEKPAHTAIRTLASDLDGYRFAARLDSASDEDYLMLFVRGSQTCLAAWTVGKPHKITVPADAAKYGIVSLLGKRAQSSSRGGKLQIEISESVQYIKPIGTSRRWEIEAGWRTAVKQTAVADGLKLMITSQMAGVAPAYSFTLDGRKLAAKKTAQGFVARYVADGRPKSRIRVQARVEGVSEPLARTVHFDNLDVPNILVAPPSEKTMIVAVSLPDYGTDTPFRGGLHVEECKGIAFENASATVSLTASSRRAMLKFSISQPPHGVYSFSLRLVSDSGADVVRVPAKRYQLVETFGGGKPGDDVAGYNVVPGGNPMVVAEARLAYTTAPSDGPGEVCARLNYKVDSGWKYIEVMPKLPGQIQGRPKAARIWLRSDKDTSAVRLRVAGKDGQTFQHTYGRLETNQWEVMTANFSGRGTGFWGASEDGVVRYPLTWETLVLVDNLMGKAKEGEVLVGPVMLCYD